MPFKIILLYQQVVKISNKQLYIDFQHPSVGTTRQSQNFAQNLILCILKVHSYTSRLLHFNIDTVTHTCTSAADQFISILNVCLGVKEREVEEIYKVAKCKSTNTEQLEDNYMNLYEPNPNQYSTKSHRGSHLNHKMYIFLGTLFTYTMKQIKQIKHTNLWLTLNRWFSFEVLTWLDDYTLLLQA